MAIGIVACALMGVSNAHAAPFIWDQDDNHIDDRIEQVHAAGYTYSFVNNDTLATQRFVVVRQSGALFYGVYVLFDHDPTAADLLTLTTNGMPVLHRYDSVPAVRSIGTFPQIQLVAAISGVERVEAVPILYPEVREGVADMGVRDPSEHVFPTWAGAGGADGSGIVVAFLDTGINDAADGPYPGHESLGGRFLGGASFVSDDSLLDTPPDGSTNPVDRGGSATQSHGTHVAGITLGTGGPSGYAEGVAPGARFVDVKVLTDTGSGTGVGDGIDWCIHNRARDWGAPGYAGIQVINLSLSSPDLTDGNDVVSQLANRAVELGIVVVASMGNGGSQNFVPSPAGASRALSIGAIDDQRTPEPGDDQWASFNNWGPRAGNGDLSAADEQKPDLLAPGVAILSADGSLLSDGRQYQRLGGTSMAAAFVSGVVASLRSQYPSLDPAGIAELLHATARRTIAGAPEGASGVDPRWRSSIGYGAVDLYAALLEMEQPTRTQIVQLELTPAPFEIHAVLTTQREVNTEEFVFERAPDVDGAPGTFAAYDEVKADGSPSIAGAVNRTSYPRTWTVPVDERGVPFWYRVSFHDDVDRKYSPERRFTSPLGPALATLQLTVVHNAYDHDVTGVISASTPEGSISLPLPGTNAADSSGWVTGESTTGNVAWSFHIDVPAGISSFLLPPSGAHPWWLRVDDGGYLNRSGRVTRYRLIWHGPQGDATYEGGPLPMFTVEGHSAFVSVPQVSVAVDPELTTPSGLRFGPNPVASGASVSFALPANTGRMMDILDLAGRRIARVPFQTADGRDVAVWQTRDGAGHALAPGLYLARAGNGSVARIVVVRH